LWGIVWQQNLTSAALTPNISYALCFKSGFWEFCVLQEASEKAGRV
jgi:hypothetical protein